MTSFAEVSELLSLWATAKDSDRRGAMATVTYIKGSAYRHPGARMLITASGRVAGMISGGCLEEDVKEHAREVMETGRLKVVTYDNRSPADVTFGLGLGCNGVVEVLIEPVEIGANEELLTFLDTCHRTRETGRVATVFSSGVGRRVYRWPSGDTTANFDDPALLSKILRMMEETTGRRAAIRQIPRADGSRTGVLIETIAPPTALHVFGAGDDAKPMVRLARQLGWYVTVIDARPAYATRERFPDADVVLCQRPDAVEMPEGALAMLMTHSFERDKVLLRRLLPALLPYVGVLGPRMRTQRLIDELGAEGMKITPEMLVPLFGPAGLDIGAETPDEIAMSIIGEMRAVLNRRVGGSLRLRAGAIHEPVDETMAA